MVLLAMGYDFAQEFEVAHVAVTLHLLVSVIFFQSVHTIHLDDLLFFLQTHVFT